jgi:CheY-like chemotaxis protein
MSRLLGHDIRLASRLGRGSLFEVKLPSARPRPLAAPLAATLLEPVLDLPPGLCVLVLDDDPMVLDAARQMLARLGCRAWCVDSLEAACGVVSSVAELHVLLVDYRLPGEVDGVEAAQRLHALLGRGIPTAVITGDILPNRLEKARQAGFPILHKPLDGARFRALLASLSRGGGLAGDAQR